jgi:hypothetical protein
MGAEKVPAVPAADLRPATRRAPCPNTRTGPFQSDIDLADAGRPRQLPSTALCTFRSPSRPGVPVFVELVALLLTTTGFPVPQVAPAAQRPDVQRYADHQTARRT